jgi:8-oxo-dGTP diphosphatase
VKNNIDLAADVVVIAPLKGSDHVLLIERGSPPYAGQWALPGGYVEPDEDARDAAARELAEETEAEIKAEDLTEIGAWHAPGRDPRGRVVSFAYAVRLPEPVTVQGCDDAADAQWVPMSTALATELAFDHSEMLERACRVLGATPPGAVES